MYPQQPSGGLGGKIPSKDTLEHAKIALELLLLVLAVPWILRELFHDPGRLSKAAAAKHLKG